MSPQELKAHVIKILGDEIGVYETEGKKKYPAIRVTPPLVDPTWKCDGLEVTILAAPEVQSLEPVTGDKLKRQWHVVQLVQFNTTRPIQPTVDKFEKYFTKVVSRVKPQTITDYEQARLSIYDPVFIGPSGILR